MVKFAPSKSTKRIWAASVIESTGAIAESMDQLCGEGNPGSSAGGDQALYQAKLPIW